MHYNALTRQHFDAPQASGLLAGVDVGRGAAGAVAAGTWVQFEVRIGGASGGEPVIAAARFLAYACPHTIAVADWIAVNAVGRPATAELIDDVQAIRQRFGMPVAKLGRLLTVEDAWRAAVVAALHRRQVHADP